jgi:hypothetical protein
MAQINPALNSSFEILIFLYLITINNNVQKAAIKKRIAEKIKGGIDFKDSSTSSKVTPQTKVVNTKPNIARK